MLIDVGQREVESDVKDELILNMLDLCAIITHHQVLKFIIGGSVFNVCFMVVTPFHLVTK